MDHRTGIKDFERFFDLYYIPVLRYCATMVKGQEEAEDIVQHAFVSIWQKSNQIDIHTSARAYLYKTVYNASLDYIKHEKIKQRHQPQSTERTEQAIDRDILLEKELSQKIDEAINTLPQQCGRIFRMSRFEHLKYHEIARELGISEKTVENQMSKALKLLKSLLKDYLLLWFIINNIL